MNLSRRELLKIIGAGSFYIITSKNILDLLNKLIYNHSISTMQTFTVTIRHELSDSDNGKEFIIPDFPKDCIIKDIRIMSDFTAGRQNWRVAFIDNPNGIIPTDIIILCKTAEIFEVGDYIFIEDEIAHVIGADPINNFIIVKRGVKGTTAMYHDKDTRIETTSNGLRIILSSDKSGRLRDSLNMYEIMSWKGITRSIIIKNDNLVRLNKPPLNINKYDSIYIKDGIYPERATVIGTNGITKNSKYSNIIYVQEPLYLHSAGVEIQKQIVYDSPIIYSGEVNSLYGILYVEEKIDEEEYPDGIIVDIEIDIIPTTYTR